MNYNKQKKLKLYFFFVQHKIIIQKLMKRNISEDISLSSSKSTSSSTTKLEQASQSHLKVHEFRARASILDDQDPRSMLKLSMFSGLYNCFYVLCAYYLLVSPFLRWKNKNQLFDTKVYEMMRYDFFICIMTWPLFYFWSYIAFLLQQLLYCRLPLPIYFTIQYASEIMMFFYCHYMVMTRNWGFSHGAFVTLQSCVFFMKMHSYNEANYELRYKWLKKGSPKSDDLNLYPNNLTIKNFTLYLWFPVLVYEISYPRTTNIRKSYLLRKAIYGIAMFLLDIEIASQYIMPIVNSNEQMTIVQQISEIMLPILAMVLVTFNLVFENFLNFFGEITYFADRYFYQDWWNATSFEEFNRKWNRPVYEFLFRHIYLKAIFAFNFSVQKARLTTFLISAFLHEYTLSVCLQQFSPILTIFMMIQLPVIALTKGLKGTQNGNYYYWWSIIQGVPIIMILYLRYDELNKKGFEIMI